MMGLNPNKDRNILAQEVVDFYYRDISKSSEEGSELVRILAPRKRIA